MNFQSTLPKADVSGAELDAFQRRLDQLDLEPIVYKITHHHQGPKWDLAKADEVAHLYKQYLTLCFLYPGIGNVPTQDIDTFWHYHILDTAKYQDDCQKLLGRFLHHFPYFGLRGAEDEQALAFAFEQTRALFAEHFGVAFSENKCEDCRDDCVSIPCGGPPDYSPLSQGDGDRQLQFFLEQSRPQPVRS
jgi:hypothetical protein